ncbi:MAG: excisionase [Lachnospiraceae bacterium]|nr:excisionase [Lachnospiraceae bacterium]
MPAKYILMNKNTPVAEFSYDLETHTVRKITDVFNIEYASPAMIDHKGDLTRTTLNHWWQGRAIPASRKQIDRILDRLSLDSTLELAEKNYGLSLTDRYWINNPAQPKEWKDINFFDNDFTDDLGLLTLGQASAGPTSLMSPNSTLGGDLQKKWTIMNGDRVLIKSGNEMFRQEVQNEVAASALHRRLLNAEDFVSYSVYHEDRSTYCMCKNMLREDEELITAWDLICNVKKPNSMNDYQFVLSQYHKNGLRDAEEKLSKMFVCDFILANSDRHWRNFGVIRNVETLEYTGAAPIYDTGKSLWCWSEALSLPIDYEYAAKPFGPDGMRPEKQLQLFENISWMEPDRMKGFSDEAISILETNENIPERRLVKIKEGLEKNMERAGFHYRETQKRFFSKL